MRRLTDRDGARHGHRANVANAKPPFGNATSSGDLCGTTRKSYPRRLARGAMDNDIGECHAGPKSSSQRLQDSFLRSESASQALDAIEPVTNLIEFFLNEAARNQRIARIFDPAPHLGDVDQINPMSNDIHIPPISGLLSYVAAHKQGA